MENNNNENLTNEVEQKPKNNKKLIIILIIVVGVILAAGIAVAGIFIGKALAKKPKPQNDNKPTTITIDNKEKVNIVKSETSNITYDTFDNGLISLKIPHGWKVDIPPVDYIHYHFKVYNPENPNYMLLFGLKTEGFLKSEKARDFYKRYYPDSVFAQLTPIVPQTTEGYYKAYNGNAKYSNTSELKYNFFPYLNNFKVIQNLGANKIGGDILRATFNDSNNNLVQGLFTADVRSAGTYYVSVDIMNPFGEQVDTSPLMTYNIVMMTAPNDEFTNWEGILDYCLGTLQFSETFLKGFNSQEDSLMRTIQANQKVYDEMSDMIMSSWESRNNSYDIISQKQSDATLGYERVYDTETNEIYKAYNGFTDDYTGDRYKPITDDMYTKGWDGYIEK